MVGTNQFEYANSSAVVTDSCSPQAGECGNPDGPCATGERCGYCTPVECRDCGASYAGERLSEYCINCSYNVVPGFDEGPQPSLSACQRNSGGL